jgi:hypothetical protein
MNRLASIGLFLPALSACSAWRGMPTHGGGKRFDEEQRVVAGAVRRAIGDMDVAELSGKTVQVQIESVAQIGGGQLILPGLGNLTGNVNEIRAVDPGYPGLDAVVSRIANLRASPGR